MGASREEVGDAGEAGAIGRGSAAGEELEEAGRWEQQARPEMGSRARGVRKLESLVGIGEWHEGLQKVGKWVRVHGEFESFSGVGGELRKCRELKSCARVRNLRSRSQLPKFKVFADGVYRSMGHVERYA